MRTEFSKTANDMTLPVMERVMCRVWQEDNSGCWLWLGSTVVAGNGVRRARMSYNNKQIGVARLMFQLRNGQDAGRGLLICHKCDNGLCVNPNHLFAGTVKDNADDMIAKGRSAWQKDPEKCSKTQTIVNLNRAYKNETGCRGVYRAKWGKFGARIKRAGVTRHLGTFETLGEASEAFLVAVRAGSEVVK